MTSKRTDILVTADGLINGDRQDTYGPPEVSFGQIADLWDAMGFRIVDWKGNYRPFTAVDVSMALIQIKAARLVASPGHEDSWVDIAGYAALGAEIALPDKTEGLKREQRPKLVFDWVALGSTTSDPAATYVRRCRQCLTYMEEENCKMHALTHGYSDFVLGGDVIDETKGPQPVVQTAKSLQAEAEQRIFNKQQDKSSERR